VNLRFTLFEFAEKYEFVKKYYYCILYPGQFGWPQENEIEFEKKKPYYFIHPNKARYEILRNF